MLRLAALAANNICTPDSSNNCIGVTANYGLTSGTDVNVGYENNGVISRGISTVKFTPTTILSIDGGLVYGKIYRCFAYPSTPHVKDYFLYPQNQDISFGGFLARAVGTPNSPYLQFQVDTNSPLGKATGGYINIQCTDVQVGS